MLALIGALLNLAPSLIGGLKKGGIAALTSTPSGGIAPLDEAATVIETSAIDYVTFEAGQAVMLGSFTEGGAKAYVVTFKAGGPAAASMGL